MQNLSAPTHFPRVVQIEQIKTETPTVKTHFFEDELCSQAKPGQFLMVWVPGVDEFPMSISYSTGNRYCGFSSRAVGDATKALHGMNTGGKIGIRGPYGNGFNISQGNKILVVAGGTGIASVTPLIEKLSLEKKELSLVLGARTASELLFLDRIRRSASKTNTKLLATTDDGTYGLKGFASEPSLKLLEKEAIDEVYTCGPEPMMVPIVRASLSKNIPIQVSLERYMKCGIGLCGSCVIGPYRVCKDGPVFRGEDLAELQEFGQSKRDTTGAKQQL